MILCEVCNGSGEEAKNLPCVQCLGSGKDIDFAPHVYALMSISAHELDAILFSESPPPSREKEYDENNG